MSEMELLKEWPDKVECWIKQSISIINGEYNEKNLAFKSAPDLKLLAIEKLKAGEG
jgi:hypothetical protein